MTVSNLMTSPVASTARAITSPCLHQFLLLRLQDAGVLRQSRLPLFPPLASLISRVLLCFGDPLCETAQRLLQGVAERVRI